jgi:hypothetical protein
VEERLESDWCLDDWLCVPLCVSLPQISLFINLINKRTNRLFSPLNPPPPTHNPPRNNPLYRPFHLPSISHHQIPTRRRTNPSTNPTREPNSMASEHARHSKPNGRPLRPRRLYPPLYPLHYPLPPFTLTQVNRSAQSLAEVITLSSVHVVYREGEDCKT